MRLETAYRLMIPLTAAYLLFVIYGSLVPLHFRYLPLDSAWASFKNIPYLDLGIVSPKPCDAIISEKDLQVQLADGKQLAFPELVKLFCLYKNLPIEVKLIENVNQNGSTVKAIFSERQISLIRSWIGSRIDRLIILGAQLYKVERALKGSRHFRDIIKTEPLGALEHVVLCKLGTDAIGLIPKIGRYLKSSVVLVPFSPKRIIKKIGNQAFDD